MITFVKSLAMKLVLAIFSLAVVVQGRHFQHGPISAYNYMEKYGQPLAEKIRTAEESAQNRIIGGAPAGPTQFPYQAGLIANYLQNESVCSGSLIFDNMVITAAHCWTDGVNQAWQFTVVLGSITLFYGGIRITSSNVIVHPEFNYNELRNDVALIKIPRITLPAGVRPIALPSNTQELFTGETAVASGFGLTDADGTITPTQFLSYVELDVISNAVCFLYYPFGLYSSNLCARARGRATCGGDSGGPFALIRNGQPTLIGVVSFGSWLGCDSGFPEGFARVTYFVDWINQNR